VSERIERLREAVEKACQCKARHAFSTAVLENFEGQVVWDGMVETFEIDGHPAAKLCYAFNFVENDIPVVKTVLGVPPADTPQGAVKVAIASKARKE
jgi:hypothetical protein